MKSAIISKYVNLGGTQYLSYMVNGVLKEAGYDVVVITGKTHPFAPRGISDLIETKYPYYVERGRIGIFRNNILLRRELQKMDFSKYNFIFNNHPNNFLYRAHLNYLHGPSLLETFLDQNGHLHKNTLFYLTKLSGIYKVYNNANFLTHGKYTKRLSERYLPSIGIKPNRVEYLYTPVDTSFSVDLNNKKKNTVLVFGRINPDKNLEVVFDLASSINARFVISGYVSPQDHVYLETLRKTKLKNVKIIANPSEDQKTELFKNAWTYLHTKQREHFGVSIAEAISSGCIPVVPKNGGAWEDIVAEGNFGFGYSSIEEAKQKIQESFDLDLPSRKSILNSRNRFHMGKFREGLMELVNELRT